MNIKKLPDGIHERRELAELGLDRPCPYCKSTNTVLIVHGALRQYKCKTCGTFFKGDED